MRESLLHRRKPGLGVYGQVVLRSRYGHLNTERRIEIVLHGGSDTVAKTIDIIKRKRHALVHKRLLRKQICLPMLIEPISKNGIKTRITI